MDFNFIKEQIDMTNTVYKNAYEEGYKQGFADGKNEELKKQMEDQADEIFSKKADEDAERIKNEG